MISENTQLGLRFKDFKLKLKFIEAIIGALESNQNTTDKEVKKLKQYHDRFIELQDIKKNIINDVKLSKYEIDIKLNEINTEISTIENYVLDLEQKKDLISINRELELEKKIDDEISMVGENRIQNPDSLINDGNSKIFLICDSVYEASKRIRVEKAFTASIFKKINFGKYTYLLGKYQMMRFAVRNEFLIGFYFNEEHPELSIKFGCNTLTGTYFFRGGTNEDQVTFTKLMKIIIFIELGDIEITILEKGRTFNKHNKKNKIANTSAATVFVVDSSWNKLIIRTDGFAVMGHFRLQPYGPDYSERKLIWIDAFEKHGYVRRPKGIIVNKNLQ